ncbi:Stk1 family PASTA domain-containing Ser/Thr kinase [Staphylococcus lutrae]|uniref:Serine/threonine-protein kinase PrkC n=1 Tax=Staphylococcus lutrae TaxID=155085 RepID=A0AAC9WJR6_9STAP|nr:Stk1 family PASTA domain-containing Ser/Thr kinase [Staphylococcus lutrae]ARJ51659.1 serine/threonine protein kinase [Staphylococcus lutrae]PNZ39071.1 serine/threonine-protein kinase [Staphylococcus lutrae]
MIGRLIDDRYELTQILGGGGMSNVYVAMDTILKRKVAVKLIHIPPNEKQATVQRFEREVQNTTILSHPNIVSVLDVGEEVDFFFLVMEYIEGPTLSDYIKANGPLEPAKALYFIEQILNGIRHAHEQGIVHRDIKPQNVMIDRNQTLKIVDFGIAKALSETTMTQTNHVVGTVQYLSPEQAKGEKTGERSDIYSLGILLYEMLIGHPPFSGETAVSIAIKQIQEAVPNVTERRRDVPQALSNVILKATEKEQSQRYRSVSEMANDVMSTLDPSRKNEAVYRADASTTKTVPIDKSALKAETERRDQPTEKTAQIPIVPTKTKPEPPPQRPVYQQAPPRRSVRKKLLFGLILFVLLGSLIIFMSFAMIGDKYSQVPEVVGKSKVEAERLLKENKVAVGKISYDYSDQYAKDRVMGVDPEEGTKVEQNSEINLVISKGQHIEKMPQLIGLTKEEAEKKLKDLGFSRVSFTTAYTQNNISKGHIEAQSIVAGEDVAVTQDKVEITESLGKRQIYVGDYTDEDFDKVKSELEKKGLVVEVEKERASTDVKKNHIISHSPKKVNVDEGDTVRFIVSTGDSDSQSDKSIDKTYTETVNVPYTGKNGKPQKVEVYITDKNDNGESAAESFNITKDTPQTMHFTVAENQSAQYEIKVDGKTVVKKKIAYDDI